MPSFGDHRSARLTSVLLLAIAVALAACATIDATTTQYVGAPRVPASDPEAAKLSGDAALVVEDRVGLIGMYGTWWGAGGMYPGRRLIAVAIKSR